MSKMTIEIDEEGLIKGKFDGLGNVSVDVEYVKALISTCRRLTLRNTALMHDLSEVTTERDKLLEALGAGEKDDDSSHVVVIDGFSIDLKNIFEHMQIQKSF